MSKSEETEEYSALLNALHLGHYVKVIQDDTNPLLSQEEEGYRQVCVFRALWALRKPRNTNQCPGWILIDKWEFADTVEEKDSIVNEMQQLLQSLDTTTSNTREQKYSIFIAAITLYLLEERLNDAYSLIQYILKDTQKSSNILSNLHLFETRAMLVYIYLSLRRPDLAMEVISWLKSNNAEFSIPCMISEAMTNICYNTVDNISNINLSYFKDAISIIQEMMDTYGRSSLLYNLEAVCYIQLGDKQTALSCLQEAHRLNAEDDNVLANLIVVSYRTGISQDAQKYTDSLIRINSNHTLLSDLKQKSELFDQLVLKY